MNYIIGLLFDLLGRLL